jgi:hypothetical protein
LHLARRPADPEELPAPQDGNSAVRSISLDGAGTGRAKRVTETMSQSHPDGEPRVVRFPRKPPPRPEPDKLSAYGRSPEPPEEYRQRMLVNGAVFLVVLALIGAALWLADSMATMRRNQDCVLSGRIGCTPVEAPPGQRW